MSRLIDADLLKSDFNDVVPFDIVELPGVKIGLYRNSIIQQVIDDQPTVDAVEVVRCTKCAKKDYCRIAEYISGMDWSKSFCSDGIKKGR